MSDLISGAEPEKNPTSDADSSRRSWASHPGLWVASILGLVYLPVLFGRIMFFRDPANWNYPARWFFRAAILRGEFPSWNPDHGLGFSTFANPLYGLFYPPNWLFLLVPDGWVISMLTWQSFAHLLWGTLGIVIIARRLGTSAVGAAVAGLAWGLSGVTTANWTAGLLLLAGAWVPWCAIGFLALARSLEGGGDRWFVGVVKAALPVAFAILHGEVFVAMMGVAFGIATTVTVVLLEGRGPASPGVARRHWRWALAFALAVGLGVGVGAITVAPARAIAASTERAQPLSRELAEMCSLHPLRLIELVAPGSMGHPGVNYPAARWVGEPRLSNMPLTFSVYLGASVMGLALAAFGRRRRLATVLGCLMLVALVISLGKYTPVHQWVRTLVPPLGYMRYPEKYLVLVVGWFSLLAGLGATRLFSAERAGLARRLVIFAAALVLLAGAGRVAFQPELGAYILAGAIKGLLALLGILGAWYLARNRPVLGAAMMMAVVSGDLAAAGWPLQGFGPRWIANQMPPAATAILADHGKQPAPPRLYRANKVDKAVTRFVPVDSAPRGQLRSMQTLLSNASATFGIAGLPGYDAAIPTLLPELWVTGQSVGQSVLRLLGVGYTILPIDNPDDKVERRVGIEPMMDPLPGSRLYRVPHALPRVYVAGRAERLPDKAVLKRIFEPEVISGQLVYLAPEGEQVFRDGVAGRAGTCVLELFSISRLIARCQVERPGVVVFIEQFEQGWRAEVDGRPTPILRANILMRGVPVAPGSHTIVLSYTPPAIAAGVGISGLSSLLLVALVAVGKIRHFRRRASSP